MIWNVEFKRKTIKQIESLNNRAKFALRLLVEDLSKNGPSQMNWPNYGKLKVKKKFDFRHCHLIKGNPTYVCCWEVVSEKLIEVYYVGTHENAPY